VKKTAVAALLSVIAAEVYGTGFRTRIRLDSTHFEQTESDQEYGFIQVSGSGSRFSNISGI